jgi:hypothetical protein
MGQLEVYNLLKKLGKTGEHKFFKVSEIKRRLKKEGHCNGAIDRCHEKVLQLWAKGYLHFKGKSILDRNKKFKLKAKYL